MVGEKLTNIGRILIRRVLGQYRGKMNLSVQQRAYVAGFLDGNGSIYVRAKPNTSYKFDYQIAPSIVLFQSEKSEDAFRQLHRIINLGYIRKRKDGILELTINRIDEIKEFLEIVEPFSIFKKKHILLMKKIVSLKKRVENEKDFRSLLELVDSYRKLNYSKKRKKICP